MNDQINTLQDDLAYLRDLAEDGGARSAGAGGAILTVAGLVFGGASLANWAAAENLFDAPSWQIWAGAVAVFLIALAVIRITLGRPAESASGRAIGMAWAGVGWGIMVLVVAIQLVAWRLHSQAPAALIPSIVLALYGIGWSVAATVTRKGWTWGMTIIAYLSSLLMAYLIASTTGYLVFAAAMFLTAAAPGVALMLHARVRAD